MQKHTTYPQKINISTRKKQYFNQKKTIFQLEKNNILTKKYMFSPKQKEQSFRLLFLITNTSFIVRRGPADFVVVRKSPLIYKLPLTQSNRPQQNTRYIVGAGLAPADFVVVRKSLPIYKLPLTQSNRLQQNTRYIVGEGLPLPQNFQLTTLSKAFTLVTTNKSTSLL